MKNTFKYAFAALALTFSLTSCSSDDDSPAITGNGDLVLEFDQAYGGDDLILGAAQTANSEGEVLKISSMKYIVSNIVLTKADGTTYTYPKADCYFVVDEANEATHAITLEGIPAGNYTKVKFGIGVDQEQYNLGAAGQGNFLATADAAGMLWTWAAGYRFVAFEGNFTSPTIDTDSPFMVHTGKSGANYNYVEVTLDLPTNGLVRETISPVVHIIADLSKILDGTNKINLSENDGGAGAMIMGGDLLPLITQNMPGVFSVDHVHNEEGAHGH